MEKNKNIYNWVHLLYSRNEYIINQLYINKIKKTFLNLQPIFQISFIKVFVRQKF